MWLPYVTPEHLFIIIRGRGGFPFFGLVCCVARVYVQTVVVLVRVGGFIFHADTNKWVRLVCFACSKLYR